MSEPSCEDVVELRSIDFGSGDLFPLPSARELALQRAYKAEVDADIKRLTAEIEQYERDQHQKQTTCHGAAKQQREERLYPEDMPRLETLLIQLRPHLPNTSFLEVYLKVAKDIPSGNESALVYAGSETIKEFLHDYKEDNEEQDVSDVVGMGAWLCAALVSCNTRQYVLQMSRSAHLLINVIATQSQVKELSEVLLGGVKQLGLRLEIADTLNCGGVQTYELAYTLVRSILCELLGEDACTDKDSKGAVSLWKKLSLDDQLVALQALARATAWPGLFRAINDDSLRRGNVLEPCNSMMWSGKKLLGDIVNSALYRIGGVRQPIEVLASISNLKAMFHLK